MNKEKLKEIQIRMKERIRVRRFHETEDTQIILWILDALLEEDLKP